MTGTGVLQDRVVIVTGAGRGLGRAYAEHAAAEGALVVVNDVDVDEAEAVAAELGSRGATALATGHDIADPAAAAELVARACEELGPLHGLVNNAGLYHEALPWEDEPASIRSLIEVNVLGTLYCTAAVARAFERQRSGGAIVNASSGALFGFPGMAAYAASKGAVLSLTYATALDLAQLGVRVNAIAPVAATRLTLAAQAGRIHVPAGATAAPLAGIEERTPDRIAPLVTYLLSPLAGGLTGQLIRFDGTRLSRIGVGDPSGRPAVHRDEWDVGEVAAAFAGPLRDDG